MAHKSMQKLPTDGSEESNKFIPATSQNEYLLIMSDTISPIFLKLLQRFNLGLLSKFVFEEISTHQHLTIFTLDEHDVFDDMFMGEKSHDRCLFLNVPSDHTLIIRTRVK